MKDINKIRARLFEKIRKGMSNQDKFNLSQGCLLIKAGYGATDKSPIQLKEMQIFQISV